MPEDFFTLGVGSPPIRLPAARGPGHSPISKGTLRAGEIRSFLSLTRRAVVKRFIRLINQQILFSLFPMIDLVKKAMFAGVGAAVVTKEKIESTLQDLVEKGKLSAEEARQMTDKIIAEGEKETEQAKNEASRLFTDLLNRAQVVTQDQLTALEKRVRDLEGRWHREFPNDESDKKSK